MAVEGLEVGAGCTQSDVVFRQTNVTHLHVFMRLCTGNGEHEHVLQAAQGQIQAIRHRQSHCSRWAGLWFLKGEQGAL